MRKRLDITSSRLTWKCKWKNTDVDLMNTQWSPHGWRLITVVTEEQKSLTYPKLDRILGLRYNFPNVCSRSQHASLPRDRILRYLFWSSREVADTDRERGENQSPEKAIWHDLLYFIVEKDIARGIDTKVSGDEEEEKPIEDDRFRHCFRSLANNPQRNRRQLVKYCDMLFSLILLRFVRASLAADK